MTSHTRPRTALRFATGLVAWLFLAGCSAGAGTVQADERVSSAGMEVLVPAGWSYGETPDGDLVVARSDADLDSGVPAGPRVVAGPTRPELPDPVDLFATSRAEETSIRGEPQQITIDGQTAVVIETGFVRGGVPIVSNVAAVSDEAGTGYTITAEAPEDQWDANVATLDEIVASVRFGGGGSGVTWLLLLLLVLGIGVGTAVFLVRRRRPGTVPVPSSQADAPEVIPADWYPDPSGEARLRYWDGTEWTSDIAD